MTFEEVKEMLKKSIDTTDNMNQVIENLIQSVYLKGYNDALKRTWIPVSERLPEKSGRYWCTFGGTDLTGIDYYTAESDAKELYDAPEEYTGWQSANVRAWMPLPESYKKDEVSEYA